MRTHVDFSSPLTSFGATCELLITSWQTSRRPGAMYLHDYLLRLLSTKGLCLIFSLASLECTADFPSFRGLLGFLAVHFTIVYDPHMRIRPWTVKKPGGFRKDGKSAVRSKEAKKKIRVRMRHRAETYLHILSVLGATLTNVMK